MYKEAIEIEECAENYKEKMDGRFEKHGYRLYIRKNNTRDQRRQENHWGNHNHHK